MKICRVCISFHRCLCLLNMFMGVAGESQTDHKEPHDGREREMHIYTYI